MLSLNGLTTLDKTLKGKVAIVTGGSRGIGEGIVKLLASKGANIVICYLTQAALAQGLAELVQSQGLKAITVQADLGSLDGPKKIIDSAVEAYLQEYGRIINITSVAARLGIPTSMVYASSKAALESLTRIWATEPAEKNVTCNIINSGPFMTNMLKELGQDFIMHT